jgi:hypothetical protein
MEKKYSFREAVALSIISGLLGAVPAIVSAIKAAESGDEARQAKEQAERITKDLRIRQARLDERDRISYASRNEQKEAYLIPIGDDDAWRKYRTCTDSGGSRVRCAGAQANASLGHTPKIVGESLGQ